MKRDGRWDFYKGLLMFSVILGHTITALKNGVEMPTWITVFIRTFDMPAFAFISGFFIQKSCSKHSMAINLLNKVTSILFPVVLWNGLKNLYFGIPFFSTGGLWFLWSIFCVSCTIICIHYAGKKFPAVRLPLFALAIIAFHTVIQDPWNVGFLLFPGVIGYYYEYIQKWFDRVKYKIILDISLLLAFIVCLVFWKAEYSVWTLGCNILADGAWGGILFRGVIGIVGWLAAKTVYDYVYDWLGKRPNSVAQRIQAGVCYVGRITLEIYILQSIFVEYLGHIAVWKVVDILGFNPFTANSTILSLVFAPVVTVCALVVLSLVHKGISKVPLIGKYIFGTTWTKIKEKNRSGKK